MGGGGLRLAKREGDQEKIVCRQEGKATAGDYSREGVEQRREGRLRRGRFLQEISLKFVIGEREGEIGEKKKGDVQGIAGNTCRFIQELTTGARQAF